MNAFLPDAHCLRAGGAASFLVAAAILCVFLSFRLCHEACAGDAGADAANTRSPAAPWDGGVAESFAGGDGSPDNPYRIQTAAQLALLARIANNPAEQMADTYFELLADIDLGGREWIPIGKGYVYGPGWEKEARHDQYRRFVGGFDGKGHTVRNFTMTAIEYPESLSGEPTWFNYGLFGTVGTVANAPHKGTSALRHFIRDIHVRDFSIKLVSKEDSHAFHAGGLLATGGDVRIERCSADGLIDIEAPGATIEAGMLAASVTDSAVFDCRVGGRIAVRREADFVKMPFGAPIVGGLVAENRHGLYGFDTNGSPNDESPFSELGWIRGCEADVDIDVRSEQLVGRVPLGSFSGLQSISYVGGLAAYNAGCILRSTARGDVRVVVKRTQVARTPKLALVESFLHVGGLVGYTDGKGIGKSLATGSVHAEMATAGGRVTVSAGGLVGESRKAQLLDNRAEGASVALSNSTIGGYVEAMAGGLIGWMTNFTHAKRCSASGTADALAATDNGMSGLAYAGGLVGQNVGKLLDCRASGNAVADASSTFDSYLLGMDYSLFRTISAAGGLVGGALGGGIASCHASGDAQAGTRPATATKSAYAGGLIGENYAPVENCFASGNVAVKPNSTSGGVRAYGGGLVGVSYSGGHQAHGYSQYGTIAKSYATGSVDIGGEAANFVMQQAGGLVGVARGKNDSVRDSFWLAGSATHGIGLELDADSQPFAEKNRHIFPLTAAEFEDKAVFAARGWDFGSVWTYSDDNGGTFPLHGIRRPPDPALDKLLSQPTFYREATPEMVRDLLKGISLDGVSVAERGYTALTPLMRAAQTTPYPEVIDILVEAGCDVNAFSRPPWQESDPLSASFMERTPLHFAATNSNPEVLKRLLSHNPDITVVTGSWADFTPLYAVADRPWGAEHFVALLEAGMDPEVGHPTYPESGLTSLELWKRFAGRGDFSRINRHEWRDPADVAKMTKALLAAGSVPDTGILMRMLSTGENEAAMLLLEAGVGPKGEGVLKAAFSRPYGEKREREVADPDPELVKRLIAANDVNALFEDGDQILTPLRAACRAGMSVEVVRLLVEAGAELDPMVDSLSDASVRDMPGYVPDNILIRDLVESGRNNPELLRYLLDQGLSAFSYLDWEPLAILAKGERPRTEMALLLAEAGADPRVLGKNRYDRKFALAAGLLNTNGDPIAKRTLSPGTANRLAFETALIMDWARANPKSALVDRRFYACATPDDVRAILEAAASRKRHESVIHLDEPFGSGDGKGLFHPSDNVLAEAAYASPYPEVIEILAKAKHKVSETALEMAFGNANPDVTIAVLRRAKDVSPLTKNMDWTEMAHPVLVPVLREVGLDLDAGVVSGRRKETNSALIVEAAKRDNAGFVKALMRAGVDLNRETWDRLRALDYVIDNGHFGLALELLDAGAECNYVNDHNKTPLRRAARHAETASRHDKEYQLLMERLEKECPGR